MEDNSDIRAKFLSNGTKNLIIAATTEVFNRFIEKVSALFKKEDSTRLRNEELIVEEIAFGGYLPCVFVHSKTLSSFLSFFNGMDLEMAALKNFSITLFEPQSDYDKIGLFSSTVFAVKKKKFKYATPLVLIDFCSLKKIDMEKYLKSHKPQIFKIKQSKRKHLHCTKNTGRSEKEQKPNGLVSISREVKKFVEENGEASLEETTDYVIELLNSSESNGKKMSLARNNIQRRVYDCVNVMASIGVIAKEGNRLYASAEIFDKKVQEKRRRLKLFTQLKDRYDQGIRNKNQHANSMNQVNNNNNQCTLLETQQECTSNEGKCEMNYEEKKPFTIIDIEGNDSILRKPSLDEDELNKEMSQPFDDFFITKEQEYAFNDSNAFLQRKTPPSVPLHCLVQSNPRKSPRKDYRSENKQNAFDINFETGNNQNSPPIDMSDFDFERESNVIDSTYLTSNGSYYLK